MSLSMYQASVPAFVQMLNNLSAILNKAEAYAQNRKIDPEVLLNYWLAPDMLPFVRQIQIAADLSKGAAARLAGVEVPKHDDTEKTFADLKARLAKTVAFVRNHPEHEAAKVRCPKCNSKKVTQVPGRVHVVTSKKS